MSDSAHTSPANAFASSRARMERLRRFLNSEKAAGLSPAELELLLETEHRELVSALMHEHMELRATREETSR
jgi:hypothetical protein